jgi:VWFA-related protein
MVRNHEDFRRPCLSRGDLRGFISVAVCAALFAWGPPAERAFLHAQSPPPTFRARIDLVSTDVVVRNRRTNQFIADLKANEFEVYEDGVRQDVTSLVLVHGNRIFNIVAPQSAPVREGIILPQSRPTSDAAGRIFLLFVDDLHIDFQQTARLKALMRQIGATVIHDGDMFGIVSTGTSSISQQLTYDKQALDAAIAKVSGGALKPKEIIQGGEGSQGPTELRHRAQVAFKTAYELMNNLAKVQNRRKAVLWISSGYDFNPFTESRLEEQAQRFQTNAADLQSDPFYRQQASTQELGEADLVHELAEVTRAANRANATIYTFDPRGLIAGQDLDQEVTQADWNRHVQNTHTSLRVLSEQTGGIAAVNMNDTGPVLERLDAETSDYYVLGYYSKNPDALRRVRQIVVRTTRPGLDVWSRKSVSFSAAPAVNR